MENIIKIDPEFYSEEIINNGIEAFKEYVNINYNNGELTIIGNSEVDIEEAFNEFMNYYIGLYNE